MCGIAGYFELVDRSGDQNVLKTMTDVLVHRGPDDAGYWSDPDAGIHLGHRRLAIIDLSQTGHQPMLSHTGRFVMVYNGEIYNHLDLRRSLDEQNAAIQWRGHSDTESLLAGFEHWGVQETIKRATGMFAFALWDRQQRRLLLGRDRLGEKPLYFGWQGKSLLFASELKALRAHPSFEGDIDRDVLSLYTRHNYIPSPYSIYKDISKLTPGTILEIDARPGHFETGILSEPQVYWSLDDIQAKGLEVPFSGSDQDAVDTLETILLRAVRQKMVADVPLGGVLSGGIDSSTIVALMQAQSDRPVNSFTIGFHEEGYNEAEHAKSVAQHLGTYHTELYVTPDQAMNVIPNLPALYDEPFSDSSQIPAFLVSEMTRQHVTVSLSGDAGDELFGGYNRYFLTRALWNKIGSVPAPLRRFAASAITAVPPSAWDNILSALLKLLPGRSFTQPGDRAHKLAEIISVRNMEDIYLGLVSHEKNPSQLVANSQEPLTVLTDEARWPKQRDFEHRMMYMDSLSYLPDDILVKVDRAAMGVSLETRVPFLNHHVVDFAWSLPLDLKVRDGQGKWILRQVLYKYIPQKLIERPKMGFGVPIDSWLRGPLRDWADSLLDETQLRQEGYFDPQIIRNKWSEHLSGQRNWQYHLWDILMFQAWLDNNRS